MRLSLTFRQRKSLLVCALCSLLMGCSNDDTIVVDYLPPSIPSHTYLETPRPTPLPSYPWTAQQDIALPPITKEYFRCRGCSSNPPRILSQSERLYDCGGIDKHSLPLRDGVEFIYPILIELLNWIQAKTQKPVIITSAHRCPSHHAWVDPSQRHAPSKHLIGAEVDFYVQGLEKQPDAVIATILDFYKSHPRYAGKKEYVDFTRSDKPTNTSTKPFYNKEIFIKKFLSTEGRNGDTAHQTPYLSIQVRYDRERNRPVTYTWADAQNYLRK